MSIIGIDVGSTMVKIIEYKEEKIINSKISANRKVEEVLDEFLQANDIDVNQIEEIVVTGIGANKVNDNKYHIPIKKIAEFEAVANGALYLTNKKEAIIASVGTGTALIKATPKEVKHLGGTRSRSRNINKVM